MPIYTIACRVIMEGATMVVMADNETDAVEKARATMWEDIEVDGAEIVDWELTGKPKQDDD